MHDDSSIQQYRREEARLRDGLYAYLQENRVRSNKEMQLLQGRCDIAAGDKSGIKLLVEIKIADPIRGVGQLFGYSWGVDPMPFKVLAVPRYMDVNSVTHAALAASHIDLWWLQEDGTPFFVFGWPDYLADLVERSP